MRVILRTVALALAGVAWAATAQAQTAPTLAILRGLAPVAGLLETEAGKAALAANYAVTGAIQTGALKQPILLPFADQQHQALKDAFITGGNAAQLADGLGTTLAAAYQARARYQTATDVTNISPAVADLIAFTAERTGTDAAAGKYFFANGTTDNKTPAPADAAAILAGGRVVDVFGKAYRHPAGSAGADPYGDSRPFQTEPSLTAIMSDDYFQKPADSRAYLWGPTQNLTDSPSYPSGHTTYGYTEAVLLALLVPERYPQEITRAAEYGNDRIILGAHYAMDVIGGRTLALYDLAHLLANDPAYLGPSERRTTVIADYQAALKAARADVTAALQAGCGDTVAACAARDTGRFADPAANEALVEATMTYNLPAVHATTAGIVEDVGTVAPEAGYLLTAAFPRLTLRQADDILTSTEGPGGGFLDDGSAFGLYSRLNLVAAAKKAALASGP